MEVLFEVVVDGDDLTVTYCRFDGYPVNDPVTKTPFRRVGLLPSVLRQVRAALDEGDFEQLDSLLGPGGQGACGLALFQVLFPDPGVIGPLMAAVSGDTRDCTPYAHGFAVRARVATVDRLLTALPWRLTRNEHADLAGTGVDWTFEVALPGLPERSPGFHSPCSVLVIAPTNPDLESEAHVDSLQGRLCAQADLHDEAPLWQVARTLAEVEDAAAFDPELVYYYGHGTMEPGVPCALLDDERGTEYPHKAVPFTELAGVFGERPPKAMYLNACRSGGADWTQVGPALLPRVPLVLTYPTLAWSEVASAQAMGWIEAVVAKGADPLEALHESAQGPRALEFEASLLTAYTNYRSWNVCEPLTRRQQAVHAHLDRHPQRRPAYEAFLELHEQGGKVFAVVGHGTAENQPERLQSLLRTHLQKRTVDRRPSPRWVAIRIGAERPIDEDTLARDLRVALKVRTHAPLAQVIRAAVRDQKGPRRPTLMLQWGHAPLDDGAAAIGEAGLEAWLHFHRWLATEQLPEDVRIYSLLTLVTGRASFIEDEVDTLDLDGHAGVRFVDLKALGKVPLRDLAEYLRKHHPVLGQQTADVARHMIREHGADYRTLVAAIERARTDRWRAVLREIRRARRNR